jgi:DNA-binding MarR family transcriptional regulator
LSPAIRDSVDLVLQDWAREDPDLPVRPVGVVTRLAKIRTRLDEELSTLFARFDLSAADFAVIAALRRAGRPYELPQAVLMERLGLTSGTVSVRLVRLEKKGIVTRGPSRTDLRSTVVTLTAKGLQLFDQVGPAHLHNEDVLLSALTEAEQAELAALLRKLLVAFEHDETRSPIGLVLVPAHQARRMRRAVGLSDVPGLLVAQVETGSAAAAAGISAGDLLTAIGGEPLRSCVTLAEHTTGAGPLLITGLRGATEMTFRIDRT